MKEDIYNFYKSRPVPNPINMTLTEKQFVDGQRLDTNSSQQNFRHFRNMINRNLFGNSYKRHNKKLSMLVVHEHDNWHRYHIHLVIEKPIAIETVSFIDLVIKNWTKTRFGYKEHHYEEPQTQERADDWVAYCLKSRSKNDLASAIDWENSTCFERR